MSETISYAIRVEVANGPKLNIPMTLAVDAIDKISVTIPDTGTAVEVLLQPGAAGTVHFFAVVSSKYGSAVKYKVNTNGAADPEYVLDQPHVLTGEGAVKMLTATALDKLFFKNGTSGDAQVQILIGRKATP